MEKNQGADEQPEVDVTDNDITSEIEKDLEISEAKTDDDQPTREAPAPAIDLATLTEEQLRDLKQKLDIVPEEPEGPKVNTVQIRKNPNGKYLIEIGQARTAYLPNAAGDRKEETHIIPVRFEGDEKIQDMNYKEFMHLDQVVCTVESMVDKTQVIPQVSKTKTIRKTGRVISLNQTQVHTVFTVKTPEGRTLQVDSKIVNA